MNAGRFKGVLRWYPEAWRRRYGVELVALLEDTYGAMRLPLSARVGLLWAAVVEQARSAGLARAALPPGQRAKAGAVAVLWGWAFFVIAGAGFAKLSEHWAQSRPVGGTALASAGYDMVFWAALVGAATVAVGAANCTPALIRHLRAEGWRQVRPAVLRASALSAIAVAELGAAAVWARGLSEAQRNGSYWPYSSLALVFALSASAVVAAWTGLAAGSLHRIELSAAVAQRLRYLAMLLAVVMLVLVAGAAMWWTAMASGAPWFINGTVRGAPASPVSVPLELMAALMVLGLVLALRGAWQLARPGRRQT